MLAVTKARTSKLAVYEYRCNAGPGDLPFPEVHDQYSISYVRSGSFGYITNGRLHELVPGSVLIGRPGLEYMCTHEHHACGDECLSFKFTPDALEEIGDHSGVWNIGATPPLADIMIMGELAQAVADGRSSIGFDEVAYLFAARLLRSVRATKSLATKFRARDRQRAIDIARWIEASSHEDIDLEAMSRAAGMSSFALLRTFSRVLGVTPHQYLIRARLRHAARLLTDDGSAVTQIAAAVGFADLSNFIRTFGRATGMSPQEFRHACRSGAEFAFLRDAAMNTAKT